MTTNTDGTTLLVAGSVTPLVAIAPYGILDLANGVSPLTVNFVTSSLSVTSGGNNGGYLITLNGAGFPLDKTLMSITLCGNKATITSISNIKADFYIPVCSSLGSQPLTVTFASFTNSNLNFN